jgi:hypothetical protein
MLSTRWEKREQLSCQQESRTRHDDKYCYEEAYKLSVTTLIENKGKSEVLLRSLDEAPIFCVNPSDPPCAHANIPTQTIM